VELDKVGIKLGLATTKFEKATTDFNTAVGILNDVRTSLLGNIKTAEELHGGQDAIIKAANTSNNKMALAAEINYKNAIDEAIAANTEIVKVGVLNAAKADLKIATDTFESRIH